jgi:hypothetical protein
VQAFAIQGIMDRMKIRLALCSTVLVAVTAGTSLAASSARPHLAIIAKNPLTLRATGFRAHERVTVQGGASGTSGRMVVTATDAGAFTARLRAVRAVGCTMITARATGSRGSIATLKIVPECAEPATP